MGRKRGSTDMFGDSATLNNLTYMQYLNRLTELAISMFEWKNLPPSVDAWYTLMMMFLGICAWTVLRTVDLMCMEILFCAELTLDITTIRSY